MARTRAVGGGAECGEEGMILRVDVLDASGSDGRDDRSEAFGRGWERPQDSRKVLRHEGPEEIRRAEADSRGG